MLNEGRFGNHYTFIAKKHMEMLVNISIPYQQNDIDF